MNPKTGAIALFILTGLVSVGCQTLAHVQPGDGRRATITGRTYEAIWQAALKVADEHFEILERDQTRGVIRAERTMSAWSSGAYVGIYITPPVPRADSYLVEVVRRKKVKTQVGEQDWEYKVLRDMFAELKLPPLQK